MKAKSKSYLKKSLGSDVAEANRLRFAAVQFIEFALKLDKGDEVVVDLVLQIGRVRLAVFGDVVVNFADGVVVLELFGAFLGVKAATRVEEGLEDAAVGEADVVIGHGVDHGDGAARVADRLLHVEQILRRLRRRLRFEFLGERFVLKKEV